MDARLCWAADSFRFPPYQYHGKFIIWLGDKWRLVNSTERELLHGLGYQHTSLCWNANKIKNDPVGFEDKRKSLVGDSFSCYSFVYVAAIMCNRWFQLPPFDARLKRMGMAPDFCCPLSVSVPLVRSLAYGMACQEIPVSALHSALLRRVNHTGSDIRISTGTILNPRNFPRQSVCAGWWNWEKLFSYKWKRSDHINSLELRSIIHGIEWRVQRLKETHLRIFHLTDSYICMRVLSQRVGHHRTCLSLFWLGWAPC